MATVIGLGVQFSANASGMTKGLSQVDRQLQNLGKQAGQAARLFDTFASSSSAASAAQQQVATDIAFLGSALRTGQLSAEQYAAELQAIVGSAQQQAAAFAEGARITEQVATAEERRAATLARLGELLQAGALKEEAYSRAVAEASGANAAAAAAERQRAADQARASQIIEDNLSAEERASRDYAAAIEELNRLRAQGLLGEADYDAGVERNADAFAKATISANKYSASVEAAAQAVRLFDTFASSSAAASAAQQQVATDIAFLGSALRTGQLNAEEFDSELRNITAAAQEQAAAFAESARLNEANVSAEERRAAVVARLNQLYDTAGLSITAYNAEMIKATGIADQAAASMAARNADVARAEKEALAAYEASRRQRLEVERAAQQEEARFLERGAQLRRLAITPIEEYDRAVLELLSHKQAETINDEQFQRLLEQETQKFIRAESAANSYDSAIEAAGDGGSLKFNELSGVLAALPGPIGNVAGRLSGLTSAGEGLGRVFSGGIGEGLSNVGASVAGLVNPFTAGLAAVAAFGAGATAVASSLVALEDRVERLGRLSNQLGVSFDFVQVLEEAGNRADVSIEQLSGSFARLQNTLAGGDEESKKASDALRQLGVTVAEFGALSEQQRIELIGERLAMIEDPAQRSAAAIALFGRSGVQLLPFFNELDGAANDIERLGSSVSDLDRARLAEFGSGIDALGVATRGLGQELTLPFLGLAEGIAQGTADFLGGVNAIASAIGDILAPEMDTLGNLFEAVGAAARVAADIIATAFRIVQQVLEPIGGSILPSVGAGIALINRQILVGAVANLARFFTAASAAAIAYATSAGTAAVSTAALGVAIRGAINSTGIGVLATGFGLAAGALLEWAFSSDKATKSMGGVASAAETAAESAARLAQELAREDAQNFEDTQRAIASAQETLNAAADDAIRFGDAGIQAAFEFQQAVRELQEQGRKEILNGTALAREVEKAKAAYDRQIDTLKELAKAEEDRARAAERAADAAIQADQRRADSFIQTQNLGGEDPATKAAEDLLAITRQIDETETAIVEARAAGDAQAEAAAIRRLQVLDQAQAAAQQTVDVGFSTQDAQRAIDDVRSQLDDTFTFDNFQVAPEAFSAAQEQLAQLEQDLLSDAIDPETFEQAADAIRSGFEDALATAQEIAQLNERYAEQAAEIERERLANLARTGPTTVQASDLRTSEGANQFLRMATGQQDPAIEEYRKQLSKLDEIRREIAKVGGTVEIVGA
jgi:hypothetical protein